MNYSKLTKTFFLLQLCFLLSLNTFSQIPEMFKYQAVLRDANGNIIANQNKTIAIDILQSDLTTSVFTESHNVVTTAQGLININIGSIESLAGINWTGDEYFLQITMDGTIMGTSQLLSVPYALTAKTVENINYSQIENTPTIPSDISELTDNSNLLFDGNWSSLTGTLPNISAFNNDEGYLTEIVEVDGSITNEIQDLSLTSNILKISNNNLATEIDLSIYLDNTNLTEAEVDEMVANNGYIEMPNDVNAGDMSYFDGTVWKKIAAPNANNMVLTYCSGAPIWTINGECPTEVGDYKFGGVVFYIFQPSDIGYVEGEEHGLVCAISDQSSSTNWGCAGTLIPGADGVAIGTGQQNSIDIQNGCSTSGIAATICNNLVLNGFDDWFLPSKNELALMYQNRTIIATKSIENGGTDFASYDYWSSTESDSWNAKFVNFGPQNVVRLHYKTGLLYVRAVRKF